MTEQNDIISKRICAVEVVNKLYTTRLLAIMVIVFSFLSYGFEFLELGYVIVVIALAISAYYIYKINNEIDYLRKKYAI